MYIRFIKVFKLYDKTIIKDIKKILSCNIQNADFRKDSHWQNYYS